MLVNRSMGQFLGYAEEFSAHDVDFRSKKRKNGARSIREIFLLGTGVISGMVGNLDGWMRRRRIGNILLRYATECEIGVQFESFLLFGGERRVCGVFCQIGAWRSACSGGRLRLKGSWPILGPIDLLCD